MKVTLKQDVEDANRFARDEEGFKRAISGDYAETKFHPDVEYLDDANTEPIIVRRVDILRGGKTYDLPPKQAENLIDLGFAQKA